LQFSAITIKKRKDIQGASLNHLIVLVLRAIRQLVAGTVTVPRNQEETNDRTLHVEIALVP